MKAFTDNLYDKLQDTLRDISADQDIPFILRARQSIVAVRAAILDLKQFIVSYQFTDPAEEIYFFKKIQPQFYCLLIYHLRIVSAETRLPVGSKAQQLAFIDKELRQMETFFEQNQDIYKYYRLEETSLDRQYFIREHASGDLPTEDAYLLYDNRFCTEMGYKIARIKANELLRPYLESRLDELESGTRSLSSDLTWKLKKVHLAELIFLLHAHGAFGNIKLHTLAQKISEMWNCRLSNISKVVEEMRIRKKERFPFTRQRLFSGEQKMDDIDLNAR